MIVKTLPYPSAARAIALDYNGPRWTSPQDVQVLCLLARHVPGAIIELGCNQGRTLRELALANPGRPCIGVDFSATGEMCREQANERPAKGQIGMYANGLPGVEIRDARSYEVLDTFPIWPPLGFIFVDGSHTDEGVRRDSEAAFRYFERTGDGGIIAWHDCYDDAPPWVGVKKYLQGIAHPVYRYAETWVAWTYVSRSVYRKLLNSEIV